MNAEQRIAFFEQLKANNPKPSTELEYSSPFELLTAVLLSAQATDISVNKGTRRLFPIANTPAALLALGEAGVRPYIQHIGLYKTKGRHLQETCRILMKQHGGEVPKKREDLEALPGVGRKTANVILNTAFGEATIAVDTHIFRVSNRTGLAPGKNVTEVEKKLMKRVPQEFLHDAHHWLILHGRYICKARNPDCAHCAVEPLCSYKQKTGTGKVRGPI
ncbi:MAG: endonuclease III [Polynucleobacter sp.]|jgi:endonuclease-3|nr:endonuclease III [Burkholderiaceae bacterium]NDG90491.1 endonuclease III [Burkholderiaceae bacterium]